jgi:hypothetical protein
LRGQPPAEGANLQYLAVSRQLRDRGIGASMLGTLAADLGPIDGRVVLEFEDPVDAEDPLAAERRGRSLHGGAPSRWPACPQSFGIDAALDFPLFFVLPDIAKGSDPLNICGGCSSGAKLFEAGLLSSTAKPAATSQSPRRGLSVRGVPGGDVVGTARPRHHGQSAGSSSARKRFLIRWHGGDLHREPPPKPDPRVACSKVVPSWD